MKENLQVSLLQWDLSWHNAGKNRDKADSLLDANPGAELYILPEMFTTGFTMQPDKVYETMEGPSVAWMKARAKNLEAVLMGSLVIKDEDRYFNRVICALPSGELIHYDKRHLFSYAGEDKHYSPGKKQLHLELHGWKIKPLVCYDLRFPVWNRNTEEAHLMVFVANWPQRRSNAWNSLLKARAIENQCYVAGVNRCGVDDNKIDYQGDTQMIDYVGEVIATLLDREGVANIRLEAADLKNFRQRYPFLKDRDEFRIL
ncbi:MAG: amidohydrolase [Saprospirales bacterium]|nr:MAG: amidohydrolase [Saprospirales bacterium]